MIASAGGVTADERECQDASIMTCHKLTPFCRKDAFHRLRQKTLRTMTYYWPDTRERIFKENLAATAGAIGRYAIGTPLSCRQCVSEEAFA
jgi:hypothetical protein